MKENSVGVAAEVDDDDVVVVSGSCVVIEVVDELVVSGSSEIDVVDELVVSGSCVVIEVVEELVVFGSSGIEVVDELVVSGSSEIDVVDELVISGSTSEVGVTGAVTGSVSIYLDASLVGVVEMVFKVVSGKVDEVWVSIVFGASGLELGNGSLVVEYSVTIDKHELAADTADAASKVLTIDDFIFVFSGWL